MSARSDLISSPPSALDYSALGLFKLPGGSSFATTGPTFPDASIPGTKLSRGDYVDTSTAQTVNGNKTLTGILRAGRGGVNPGYENVATYGAVGDNVADDTAAVQAALTAASNTTTYPRGCMVWFPPGNYRITSTLTVTGNYVCFGGHGKKTSTLQFVPGAAAGVLFSIGAVNGVAFRNLYLACSGSFQTSATAFVLTGTTAFTYLAADFTGFACAAQIIDCTGVFFSQMAITQCAASTLDCFLLDGTVQKAVVSGTVISGSVEVHFTDVVIGAQAAPTPTVAGYHLRACDGVWWSNCDTLAFAYALLVNPTTAIVGVTKVVAECFFSNCDFDQSFVNSVNLAPGQQGAVCNLQFMGGRHASLNGNCTYIQALHATAIIAAIAFNGTGHQLSTTGYGCVIQNNSAGVVQDVSFVNCTIAGNNLGGIYIGSAVDGVLVLGCKFRAVPVLYTPAQPYSVTLSGSTNVVIENCDVRGQSSAPFNISVVPADGSLRIRNCAGDTYVATAGPPSSGVALLNTSGRGITYYVSGGTVSAIAINSIVTNFVAGSFRVPAGSNIKLTYSAAPLMPAVAEL